MSVHRLLFSLLAPVVCLQDRPAPAPPSGLEVVRRSQLAVALADDRGDVRFRATLVARGENSLRILTAAHCVSRADIGRSLRLAQGASACDAEIVQVVRNPNYEGETKTDTPGADNAFVELRPKPADDDQTKWLASLAVAQVAADAVPGPAGGELAVLAIDQKNAMHRVRAANYTNPRWLEWGDAYRPIPGDSGSGVFFLGTDELGELQPLLIGVVTDRSQLGGGASLVFTRMRWLAELLPPAEGD
jgi:hypothetical protein